MIDDIVVKVPATSANMGPGFDSLGIALDVWNEVRISKGPFSIKITGKGENELPTDAGNFVYKSFCKVFEEIGQSVPEVALECTNQIPLTRGMGSSSAALIGGLMSGNALAGFPLSTSQILNIGAKIENHPDNVAPALLGGVQIGIYDREELITASVTFPEDLKVVLYVPNQIMPTKQARNILASEVARKDAVYNIGRSALLVQSLITGDLYNLKYATQDMLHQPQRQKQFFPMKNIIKAAMEAGALGAFLSGAGSSILAFTRGREYTIGYEMADAAMKSGLDGDIIFTSPTLKGAYVEN
ncbi:homoserine kinase [Chloroflexi bacterium]|nr:homoserine kinase [Chloroflexota bacterium]